MLKKYMYNWISHKSLAELLSVVHRIHELEVYVNVLCVGTGFLVKIVVKSASVRAHGIHCSSDIFLC